MGRMRRTVLVIGGGASGMTAAIHAARNGADVTILEHTERVGKKILSTGNGRCNLTNLFQSVECYRCSQADFPMSVIAQVPVEETLRFFGELGIVVKNKDGYLYPNSEQASAVLDVLRMELEHRKVRVVYDCRVQSIRKVLDGFLVGSSVGEFRGDALILATGSKAAPMTGSDGSGYELAKKLGHTVITPLPALVQLRCGEKHYKQLGGIRVEAELTLLADQKPVIRERGELQLTDYGISGIPVFQISRYGSVALARKQEILVRIDFMPGQTMEETGHLLRERAVSMGYKSSEQWMVGLLNKKLAAVILKLAGISPGQIMSTLREEQWNALLKQIKVYETAVIATNPFENAQVCCGGVSTEEVNQETMESKLVSSLYLAGELLDVDGICGGYNLQWAWSSGTLAGTHAGRGKL